MLKDKIQTKLVSWSDIRVQVQKLNPELFKAVEQLSPSDDLKLIEAQYNYGDAVVNKGKFHLPIEGEKYIELVSYANQGLPTGVVMQNSYELTLTTEYHDLPVLMAKPGDVFALWKHLEHAPSCHPTKIFSIYAGGRSTFLLPNVSNFNHHKRLKRDLNFYGSEPKSLSDHWSIFVDIARQQRSDWQLKIILFTNDWMHKIKKDPAWKSLYIYLLENAWQSSAVSRNKVFFDYIFSCAKVIRNMRPNAHLFDTASHVLSIIFGVAVGFRPLVDNKCLPLEAIQSAYVESYGLKRYIPTILGPTQFDLSNSNTMPVYYSLNYPTSFRFSPKSRKLATTGQELSELRYLLSSFFAEIRTGSIELDNTAFALLPTHVELEFFHSREDKYGEIQPSLKIPETDPDFLVAAALHSDAKFAENGQFVRGCVKISRKQ